MNKLSFLSDLRLLGLKKNKKLSFYESFKGLNKSNLYLFLTG